MGMNSQVHLKLKTEELERLKREASKYNTNVSSLIRQKLFLPPTEEEIILLRQLKLILMKKREL